MNFFKPFSSPCCVNVNQIFLDLLNLSPVNSFKTFFKFSSSAFHGCTDLFENTVLVLYSCCIFWMSSVTSSSSFSQPLPPPPVFSQPCFSLTCISGSATSLQSSPFHPHDDFMPWSISCKSIRNTKQVH